MKAVLSENEAVNNEAAGAGYVENFALKVFMSADNDDRNGITGKWAQSPWSRRVADK
jgi:vacuolar protein sorting-associated protein VTA1